MKIIFIYLFAFYMNNGSNTFNVKGVTYSDTWEDHHLDLLHSKTCCFFVFLFGLQLYCFHSPTLLSQCSFQPQPAADLSKSYDELLISFWTLHLAAWSHIPFIKSWWRPKPDLKGESVLTSHCQVDITHLQMNANVDLCLLSVITNVLMARK